MNIDLQQRGVEFLQLFGPYNHLRESLLEKMPAMTINKMNGANGIGEPMEELSINAEKIVNNNNNARSNTDALLDLLGSGDDIIMSSVTTTATLPSVPAATSNLLDLLGDIDLSVSAVPIMNNNNVTSPVTMSILDDNENTKIPDSSSIFNLNGGAQPVGSNYDLGLDFLTTTPTTTTTTAKTMTVFDKNDLVVTLATMKQSDYVQVLMLTTNNSMETLEQYLFQVSFLNHFINYYRVDFKIIYYIISGRSS